MPRKPNAREASNEVHTLTDLEQIKVLADPLRVRLLGAFCEERTTKQVAELLGEPPTRLYHHVEALERVGLIALSRTQRKRGTLERYYVAIAKAFRADPRLFSGTPEEPAPPEGPDSVKTVVAGLFEQALTEMGELIDVAGVELQEEGLISFVEVHASERQVRRLRNRLQRLFRDLQRMPDDDGSDAAGPDRRCRLLLAYYPLDSRPDGGLAAD